MRINIFGASGSGVTTLGTALSDELNYAYFDSDQYFWLPSDPPFTQRREKDDRNKLVSHHLSQQQDWILGGSVTNWQIDWNFDLAVFLQIPADLRMERLAARELKRYGDIIQTDPERNKLYTEFMNWAARYDEGTVSGRTLLAHQNWMQTLQCPLLKITGNTSVQERLNIIMDFMDNHPTKSVTP